MEKKNYSPSASVQSTNYSVEMGSVNDNDPNHIHFVSVGRVKDQKLLISAITNKQYQRIQDKLQDQAYSTLPKASYADQMQNKTKSLFNINGTQMAHQTYMDKNFIVFAAVTSPEYPESTAQQFLQHLAENLYDADPIEFKRDPQ